MIIACFANNVHLAYIYIRGEFTLGARILEKAIEEAKAKNFLGKGIGGTGYDLEIYIHRGAGAYICGEETGLIESLEGKRAYPRIKPPYFPAVLGLYMCPTIVNNVETLCNIKHIVAMGGAEYAKIGKPNNTGTRLLCVSGDVEKPGYFEFEVGALTLGQLIDDVCGGIKGGRKLKAVIPGGSSAKVLKAGERYKIKSKKADGTMEEKEIGLEEIPLDFDTLAAAGSMAGSGGIIIMDETRDMVDCLANINTFYAHESCGQCTPCREGSLWMKKITDRLAGGRGLAGDVGLLTNVADNIAGPHHLRLRRGLRLAGAELRRQVPGRIRKPGAGREGRDRRQGRRAGRRYKKTGGGLNSPCPHPVPRYASGVRSNQTKSERIHEVISQNLRPRLHSGGLGRAVVRL